jgi:CPA1 family monovalent cation:H+ antiporter
VKLLQTIIILQFACVALAWLADRLRVSYPIMLVLGGAAFSFVHVLPRLRIDGGLLLAIVLPPIIYQAALFTSWRDFRANLRAIGSLAVGLVVATTVAVAVTARWLAPEASWPLAFALGALASAPDAAAATSILGQMDIPRRIITIVEGESLVNDASSLLLYHFAVAAAVARTFSLPVAMGDFVLVAVGGIAVGMAIGKIFALIQERLDDPVVGIMVSVLVAYSAYLVAEALAVSAVLSVVAAGLLRSRWGHEALSPNARLLAFPFWRIAAFLMNSFVFILIGLELPAAVKALGTPRAVELTGYVLVLSAVAVGVRFMWVFAESHLFGNLHPRMGWSESELSWKESLVIAWSGMRGIVSIAAALALPSTLPGGSGHTARDAIVFITFGVVFVLLVVPGFTLGPLVRLLGLRGDAGHGSEGRLAREEIVRAALQEVARLETEGEITLEAAAIVRARYEARLDARQPDGRSRPWANPVDRATRAAAEAARRQLIALWREGRIGDAVLHEIEHKLDLEESRLG